MGTKLDKLDILLEEEVSSEDLTPEEQMQSDLETAERYINIAQHMNQFEDQDTYYSRAIKYTRKVRNYYRHVANDDYMDEVFTTALNKLGYLKFTIRSEGKIQLYEEACAVRDKAKTPSDYYNAQTIFERIHRYELNHKIDERWVSPELFARTQECVDSEQQAEACKKMAEIKARQNKRRSLIASIIIIAGIAAFLSFTRTIHFRYWLGTAEAIIGDHQSAWQAYKYVYDRGRKNLYGKDIYKLYIKNRYLAAKDAERIKETGRAIGNYRACADENYKDSEERLLALELDRLRNPEKYGAGLGMVIPFGNVDWRILDIEDDRVLLFKESAMKKDQVTLQRLFFHDSDDDNVTWETSWLRHWLNDNDPSDGDNGFLGEQFTPKEQERIIPTKLFRPDNTIYNVSGGNETVDKLFLMTAQEANYYKQMKLIPKTKTCWWLRTPGRYPNSMVFVLPSRKIMYFGYDVSTVHFTVKPCMWVDISK